MGPSKGLAKYIVEILDEIQDPPAQVVKRDEAGAFEQAPRQNGEPDLGLIEPRTMSRCLHEANPVLRVSQ